MLPIIWLSTVADIMTNLAAGWFAAATVIPAVTGKEKQIDWWLLCINIALGILSAVIAINLQNLI